MKGSVMLRLAPVAFLILGLGALTLTGCVVLPPPLPVAQGPSSAPAASEAPTESNAADEAPDSTPSAVATPTPTPAIEPVPDPGPDLASFQPLDERAFALLARDPDAHVGQSLIVTGVVTQFDAATGRCGFLASVGHDRTTNSYDYPQNAVFAAGDGEEECPVLDDVVEDDHVQLWVTSLGSYSYDTQIGGNTTVPSFEVHQVEQLPKQEY